MFLEAFRVLKVSTRSDLDNLLRTTASGRILRARRANAGSSFEFSRLSGEHITLFYLHSTFASEFEFEPVAYTRFVFQLRGACRVKIGSLSFDVGEGHVGYSMPDGIGAFEAHPSGYSSLALRVSIEALMRRLAVITGRPVLSRVEFDAIDGTRAREFVRDPILAFAREADFIHPAFLMRAVHDWESLTLNRLLLHLRHNYSNLFDASSDSTTPARLALVEEFIAENWNRSITIEDLAALVGVSGRTLVRDFIRKHDETPRQYIKRLRLGHARRLLQSDPKPSVMTVALQCGFSSLGHFAAAYRKMFGTLPSARHRNDF